MRKTYSLVLFFGFASYSISPSDKYPEKYYLQVKAKEKKKLTKVPLIRYAPDAQPRNLCAELAAAQQQTNEKQRAPSTTAHASWAHIVQKRESEKGQENKKQE